MKKKILKNSIAILCVLAVALLFYALNRLTPLYADDYAYTRSFVTKEQLSSVADICASMRLHYVRVNGRIVVHFLAQLFLWWGKPVFDVINTAAFLSLGTLMYVLAAGTLKDFKITGWLLGLLGLWLLAPGFGQSYLWLTGACNYLYGPLIILAFLVTYRQGVASRRRRRSFALSLLYLPAGLLAGWTNENTGVALIAAVLCFTIKSKRETGRFCAWMGTGFIGSVTGLLCMILAPGQTARLSSYPGLTPGLLLERALRITNTFLYELWPAILIFLVLLAVYFIKSKENRWKNLANTGIFTLAALLSAYSMVLAPYFPERAWSGTVIFGMIALASLLNTVTAQFKHGARRAGVLKSFLTAGLAVVFIVTYVNALPAVRDTYNLNRERMENAENQIADGRADIVLSAVSSGSKYSCFEPAGDLSDDPANWLNVAVARYLGADTVTKEVS